MISEVLESRLLGPPILSFVMAIGLHIVVWRCLRRRSLKGGLLYPLGAGGLLCVSWLALQQGSGGIADRMSGALAPLLIYMGLAYTYADLYGFHRTSIRLQALRLIHREGGAATQDELQRGCGSETTVDRRLAQYLRSGDLIAVDGRYRMGRRRILVITHIFLLMRRVMLGARAERIASRNSGTP